MGVKRRNFLIGAAAVAGAGVFGLKWADSSARGKAISATVKPGEGGFAAWIKIAPDDTVTVYSPTIDFGQGSHTALAQMVAEELDADYVGFEIGDEFVVGYGLDYMERYRNLPFVGTLAPHVYAG